MKYSLPDSASDLLIRDGKLLMRSLSIYEVLKRFGHIIRLTPFRFEDFCVALHAQDQSPLIAEIHIQLLRTLIREDRQQQTWYGPPDLRDSVNIYFHLADHATWPAALRIYLSSDPYGNATLLENISGETKNYPFNIDLAVKVDVLEQLCDQFLLSNLAREEIVNGSNQIAKHENSCRFCSKANGDLIPCGTCPAVYHLKCSDPISETSTLQDDEQENLCALCRSNHVIGVTDCISNNEESGNIKRIESLGLDKSGRRYWFLTRRLFVVDDDEDDVKYYTKRIQLDELLDCLKENKSEKSLINNIQEQRNEIERQMKITEDLYSSLMKDYRNEDGTYTQSLGQDGLHKNYVNHYSAGSNSVSGKNQNLDRDLYRSLGNKFCISNSSSMKWHGLVNTHLNILTITIRSSILRFESSLPQTFIHPCWHAKRTTWIKSVNIAQKPEDLAIALSFLETSIRTILFKPAWYESVGFSQLFRSTFLEREELKKTDRQPRGFERREWVSHDFELSYRLGTMVKFSSKLKPVKHQVWKQKGEEYRLTGLNGWLWQGRTFISRLRPKPKLYRTEPFEWLSPMNSHPFIVDMIEEKIKEADVIDIATALSENEDKRILYPKKPKLVPYKQRRVEKLECLLEKKIKEREILEKEKLKVENCNGNSVKVEPVDQSKVAGDDQSSQKLIQKPTPTIKKCVFARPQLYPCHDFLTKKGKVRSLLVLPDLELKKLARSGGLKEAKSFLYNAKQNNYVWPYGMTPRPSFRICWLYRNRLINTIQDVGLQLKVLQSSLRWDDLQARPPAAGHNIISTDEATIAIHLLKKRDKLPYLMHSEYLIKKIITPIEQPTKYRKIGIKKSTPSARSGLRTRRQTEHDEEKGPTTEEIWVSEDQLELWEIRQFDEKIERQNQLARERAAREEAEKRRKLEEERKHKLEMERRKKLEEEAKRVKLSQAHAVNASTPSTPQAPRQNITVSITPQNQQTSGSTSTTPVLRYFRTEHGQIIRLPASYLQRGTPLILRHVGPGPNQTNTYIIRPQISTTPNIIRQASPIRFTSPTIANTNQTPNKITVEMVNTSSVTPTASGDQANAKPITDTSKPIIDFKPAPVLNNIITPKLDQTKADQTVVAPSIETLAECPQPKAPAPVNTESEKVCPSPEAATTAISDISTTSEPNSVQKPVTEAENVSKVDKLYETESTSESKTENHQNKLPNEAVDKSPTQ